MAREIRITVDDDEVFERMKARKHDLDLTWEEVLQRGLRDPGTPVGPGEEWGEAGPGAGFDPFGEGGPGHPGGEDHQHPGEGWGVGDFADQLQRQIQQQVRSSLQASMESVEEAGREIDREMRDLQAAEDAVLQFPALADERRYHVPLRVNLSTSRDGLAVEVVAVRQGKSVSGTNRFDSGARRTVNEQLARGGTATLAFGADGEAETYDVAPVLSWGRREDGSPTVTDVAVDEVLFDDPA